MVKEPFRKEAHWIVERNLVLNASNAYLIVSNVLIKSKNPVIPVANSTASSQMVQKGDALATIKRANAYLDKPLADGTREVQREKASTLITRLIDASLAENQEDWQEDSINKDDYGPKTAAMPETTNYSLTQMCKLLDIGDLPEELKTETWTMLE